MEPVVHFEMPAEDKKRMREFYEKAFGWETNQMSEEFGDYITVTTTETDKDRMVKKPGTINGGFFPKSKNSAQHPVITIQVEDIQASIKKIKQIGGTIVSGPTDIPQVGTYVSFDDTEGNRVSMLQPPKH